ncbi:hypothetical protein PV327_000886 [Microctonus hyperodae]|uniref:Uncharacterized protein n=1 Tax=Microctonus hyperodae TaxID=165561 RepID=A0AA39L2R6_MICHY|nr:hypothetical protein PV327_000886 [Microctonus hyperodae]
MNVTTKQRPPWGTPFSSLPLSAIPVRRKQLRIGREAAKRTGVMGCEMRPPGRDPGGLFNLFVVVGFLLVGPTSLVRTQGKS